MSSKKSTSIRLLLAIVISIGALLGVSVPAFAVAQIDLSLTPSTQNVVAGPANTFTVTIAVTPQSAQQVAGIDAFLTFNPAYLQVDSVVMAPASPLNVDLTVGDYFDNTLGQITYSAGKLSGTAPSTPFNLAVVTLHGIAGVSNTPIAFETVSPRATTAAFNGIDYTGTLTPATVTVLVAPTANFSGAGAISGNTTVTAGETVNFTDTSTGPPTSWDWDFDTSTPSTDSTAQNPTHVYTVTGTYTVRLTATNTVGNNTMTRASYITVVPAALATVTVTPASQSLVVGAGFTFTAATYDVYNNARTGDPIVWSVTNATAGSIIAGTGAFTAGTVTGTYTNVVVATSGPITGNASVTVTVGPLATITVSPANPSVVAAANQTYTAATFDQYGNPRTGDTIAWSVTNATAGSINASTGVLTAGTVAAGYNNVVVATSGAITGNASVTIIPAALHHITVSPASPSVVVGATQAYTATTYDQYNNQRTGDTIAWSVTNATAGSINASTGSLTAGTVTGVYSNVIVATSGAVTGNASVTLTPGPLATIVVSPSSPSVGITATRQFTAASFDTYGNARTGDTFVWSVAVASTAAGSINSSTGLFTATSNLANIGTYTNAIIATSGAVNGTTTVIIVGGIINGTVTLQGGSRPALKRLVGVTLKIFTPGTTSANLRTGTGALATFTATTVDSSNSNTVTFQVVGLVPANYDITLDSGHTLMNVKLNVAIGGGNNAVNFGTILEGDCNDDGQVTALDFSILATSYGKSNGQVGYDTRADYDGSGQVNSVDFSLLAANYLKTSPQTAL